MRLMIIGATGATGSKLVDLALAEGDEVVAFTRRAGVLQPGPGLDVVTGELADTTALASAMAGADAVLVAIGASSMRRVTVMQENLPLVTSAMKAAELRRLVVLSAFGVGESERKAALPLRIGYRTFLRSVYADKVAAEAELQRSAVDATLVMPVMLTDEMADTAEVRALDDVVRLRRFSKVSRAAVAAAMLDAAKDPSTIGQRLVVSAPGTLD